MLLPACLGSSGALYLLNADDTVNEEGLKRNYYNTGALCTDWKHRIVIGITFFCVFFSNDTKIMEPNIFLWFGALITFFRPF